MKEAIKVLKRNLKDEIAWQYEGQVLRREPNVVVLEAFFNRPDMPFMDVTLKANDRFVETFYTDRWYNILRFMIVTTASVRGGTATFAGPQC